MSSILEVHQLVKKYPGVTAVDSIDFAVQTGECFGLLGPNGAGKTTTVEIMEGITRPTSGEVRYRGEPVDARFRREVGIQFQSTALQDFLTVRETLQLFRSFYSRGLEIDELTRLCTLGEYLDRDARKLSGGQRQRLLLALALVNDPEVLFLDEPTTGLDPQARRNFWDLIRAIKARNKTVILTTHYMEEAFLLCDRIAIMDHGHIIAEGPPATLLAKHFHDVILQIPKADFGSTELGMETLDAGENIEISTSDVDDTLQKLMQKRVSLARLQIRARTLEDLFLELTGKELRA
ncbi:MAG TPA: ABC transporter ATP-binding protein [Gammaproteobacteria bacterium]|jgi:ABC-2 type transport system ATP-binding protein|nr:ABC transporter ATP-binding protein [Gammaproteobacteria bacterium]